VEKKMKVKFICIFVFILFLLSGCASKKLLKPRLEMNDDIPRAEREFRGVWVATVDNIDWPSEPGLTTQQQKNEILTILDTAKALNLNAIILQVRPQCDALYQSNIEPWSYYLSGKQGQAPEPYYDPLKFWIKEAHKRGLELHAWFNPYRAHHPKGGEVSEFSVVNTHPEIVKELKKGYYWLDPAKEETQDYSISVVMDVLKRYDIDGIHFDDYFYPYPSYNDNEDFPDEDTWQEYKKSGGELERNDWRREAVNTFIKKLYASIKFEKPYVKFGLSPFGIWRPGYPESIQGFDQYDVLFADAKLWINEGWIDYFTPQLYWPINQVPQSFPVLLGWWTKENRNNRNLWPGMYLSKFNDEKGIDEITNQIMINRGFNNHAPGHVHFSMIAFLNDSTGIKKSLLKSAYRKKALIPPSPWLDQTPLAEPIVTVETRDDSVIIRWSHQDEPDIFHWVVYLKYQEHWNYEIYNSIDRECIIPIVFEFQDRKNNTFKMELIEVAVSAVDRIGNESKLRRLPIQK
jgi:uncharacterized lipoprotein YddW (UPF0748 family)